MPRPRLLSPLPAAAAALAVASLALTGCTSSTSSVSTPTPTATEAQTSPSAMPSPSTSASALGLTCDEVLSDEVLASLGANLSPTTGYLPAQGSYAAQIASFGGVTCSWSDSAGAELTVAIAQPAEDDLTAAETGIGNSGTASTLFGPGLKAWTSDGGGTFTGDFEVFTPAGYWISTTSSLYTAPDSTQAQAVMQYVLQALPAG